MDEVFSNPNRNSGSGGYSASGLGLASAARLSQVAYSKAPSLAGTDDGSAAPWGSGKVVASSPHRRVHSVGGRHSVNRSSATEAAPRELAVGSTPLAVVDIE
eukprot:gene1687-1978_t